MATRMTIGTIECIPEWHLTSLDERNIADLLDDAFGAGVFNGRSFHKQRHHLRLIVRDGHHIIGHMALQYRAARLNDRLFDYIGLAEVATASNYRGQGIASQMLRAAIDKAHGTLADFMILFGTAKLYSAAGFVAYSNKLVSAEMSDCRTTAILNETAETLMVKPLGVQEWDSEATLDLLGPVF
ncbi:GNAT family N-acetyltransferase [Qingshengfaniella alkalisoli]|uniref:GNAT family N-acetyltransferase n=1 Tax=Qingshengfaniella alkalisoli TaxID=2599296 RepID=A0A5B8IY78_9RHOB|nr:GNAT family N-acetyltransferase [Qingshengfaniella alkalisoli]QDY71102.1 GNAT family N-acetyltransferase [Qingshengfaniella alkalisoli]